MYNVCMDKESTTKLIHRLNRAEGQIRALKRIIESGTCSDCKEFITQVKAARSALQGVSEEYISHHIHKCEKLPKKEREEQINEAIKLIARG